jgi:hypothetical protein
VGGVWTEDVVKARGFVSNGQCPLCEEPDSLFHRIWLCKHPDAVRARSRFASPDLVRLATQRRHDDDSFFWATGLFQHPECMMPAAARSVREDIVFDSEGKYTDLHLSDFDLS